MRTLLLAGLLLCGCLTVPVLAQPPAAPASAPASNAATLARQRDLLQRFGTRLKVWATDAQLYDKLTALASPDQMQALASIQLTAAQRDAILKLLRDNPPTGLDKAGFQAWQKNVGPKIVDILGSNLTDNLLQLVPSPQQVAKAEAILKDASTLPSASRARDAATELAAALTGDQKSFLNYLLNMAQPAGPAPSPPPEMRRPIAVKGGPKPERRLVMMRMNTIGDCYAEITPEFDYTVALPRTYRVEGIDASVLSAVSNQEGLPVRLLGFYNDDVIQVAAGSLSGPLPVEPIIGVDKVWRGRLPATITSTSPPTVSLDTGRGRTLTANLLFQSPGEEKAFQASGNGPFLLGATCLTGSAGNNTLVDLDFAPYTPPSAPFASRALIQVSEEFLRHVAREFLAGNQRMLSFKDSTGQTGVFVSDLGVSLKDCQASQVRILGRMGASVSGLNLFEAEAEEVTALAYGKGTVTVTPVPNTIKVRMTFPAYVEVPDTWVQNIKRMLNLQFTQGFAFQVPPEYTAKLVSTGLLEQAQVDTMQLFTYPSGDRRTSLIAVGAPATAAYSNDALRNRILAPGEVAVALGDEAINAAIKKTIPPMLPIIRDIPKEYQKQGGVTLEKIELPALDLAYSQGLVQINNCEVHVHWSYGLFSGVEPACKFKGTAKLGGTAGNVTMRLTISQLDFLSTRITDLPAAEQKADKDKLMKALQDNDIPLMTVAPIAIPMISSRAQIGLSSIDSTPTPSEQLIRAQLLP